MTFLNGTLSVEVMNLDVSEDVYMGLWTRGMNVGVSFGGSVGVPTSSKKDAAVVFGLSVRVNSEVCSGHFLKTFGESARFA